MAGGNRALGLAHQDPGPSQHRSADAAVDRGRAGSGAGVRLESARPAAGGAGRRARHHGPRSRLPLRRQGRGRRCHRQGGGHHGDLSARAAAALGRGAGDARQARGRAPRRPDRDRQRHRVARDRQARHRSGQAAAGPEDVEDRGVGSRRLGLFGLGLCVGGIAGTRRHPARRGVDRAAAAGSAGRAGQDRSEGDRRRAVSARSRREQAGALARCRGGGLRQRGRRRRQHRLGAAAGAGVGHRLGAGAKHRAAPRRQRPVQVAQGAEGGAAARAEGVRAMRRLPAHHRRRRSARCLRRASGSLSGGAQDSCRDQERHQGADRQRRDRAPAEAAELSSTTPLACRR